MLIYQNLAYCRYLQLWAISNLLNIVKSNPNISLFLVSILHLYNINFSNKRIFIVLQDYLLIYCIFFKIKNKNFVKYFFRIWYLFLFNKILFNRFGKKSIYSKNSIIN